MIAFTFLFAILCFTFISGSYVLEVRFTQRNCRGASRTYTIRKTNDDDKIFRRENIIEQNEYWNNTFLDDMFYNLVHIRQLPDPKKHMDCYFNRFLLRGEADVEIEDPETGCIIQHYPTPIGTKCLITLGSPGKCSP